MSADPTAKIQGSMTAKGWIWTGGTLGLHLVYDYEDDDGRRFARAYVAGDDDGRATIVGFDLQPGARLRRADLERRLRDDLDALADGTIGKGGPSARVLAEWCGINPEDAVRSSRGPRRRHDNEVARFADEVVRDSLAAACSAWHISRRRGRELMCRAEDLDLVTVERAPGFENRYRRHPDREVRDDARDGRNEPSVGDRHRMARLQLEATRRALHDNWERKTSRT